MIGDSEAHLYTMNSFWKVVLFGTPGYTENPFAKYDQFIITARHLERWLKLFQITVDTHFKGSKAEEAKVSAGKMAIVFQNKLARVRDKDRIIL
ncbi:group III truncated hemoglobin [Mucilaginibacter sp. SMC90]|nr:group III truncated hemoglobin [Mucilaginibacter sp. SMC90]UOE48834.1 group III truncated hemoglobin [Mucilaginibacter sp. SMC90]